MAICVVCGVEYEENNLACPLCDPVEDTKREVPPAPTNMPSEVLTKYRREIRRQMWELTGIAGFLVILFSVLIDLVPDGKVTWALYPAAGVASAWLIVTSILLLDKKPFLMLSSLTLTLLSLTAVIDLILPPLNWFHIVALPIIIAAGVISALLVVIIKKSRMKGFNILALILTGVSILCVVIEIFTKAALYGNISIRWSLIVAASLVPVSGVLFYIHYRMQRGQKLGSYFHI